MKPAFGLVNIRPYMELHFHVKEDDSGPLLTMHTYFENHEGENQPYDGPLDLDIETILEIEQVFERFRKNKQLRLNLGQTVAILKKQKDLALHSLLLLTQFANNQSIFARPELWSTCSNDTTMIDSGTYMDSLMTQWRLHREELNRALLAYEY